MDISAGVVAAMVAPASEFLRPRELTGLYPFRGHRTCAEWALPAADNANDAPFEGAEVRHACS